MFILLEKHSSVPNTEFGNYPIYKLPRYRTELYSLVSNALAWGLRTGCRDIMSFGKAERQPCTSTYGIEVCMFCSPKPT
jgi:hypothetical protein